MYFGPTLPSTPTATTSPTYTPAANLSASTVYRWRIDARNSAGSTTGDVWMFTTAPPPQITVTPPNGLMFTVAGTGFVPNGSLTFRDVYQGILRDTRVGNADAGGRYSHQQNYPATESGVHVLSLCDYDPTRGGSNSICSNQVPVTVPTLIGTYRHQLPHQCWRVSAWRPKRGKSILLSNIASWPRILESATGAIPGGRDGSNWFRRQRIH